MQERVFEIEVITTRVIQVQVPIESIEDNEDPEQFAIDSVNDDWDDYFISDEETRFIKSIREIKNK